MIVSDLMSKDVIYVSPETSVTDARALMTKENVNKLFAQFKNKYVSVDLRDNNHSEGKVIAIDNYLNLVLENENGLETIKGGNIIFISVKEDK